MKNVMRKEYDFSKAKKNPYVKKGRKKLPRLLPDADKAMKDKELAKSYRDLRKVSKQTMKDFEKLDRDSLKFINGLQPVTPKGVKKKKKKR